MFGLFFANVLSLALVSSAVPEVTAPPQEVFEEVVVDDSGSLFDGAVTSSFDLGYPEYALDSDGALIENVVSPSPAPDASLALDASSALDTSPIRDASLFPEAFDYLTYSDVEEIVNDAMELANSTNVSLSNAYLSSTIVDCFSKVVAGLPAGTHYVAYRNNSTDSNEGYLLFSSDAKYKNGSLVFPSGSKLVHYYRYSYQSGYQTYWDYKYDVIDITSDYLISVNNGALIYTDLVDGFPTLSQSSFDSDAALAFFFIIFSFGVILILVFRKK